MCAWTTTCPVSKHPHLLRGHPYHWQSLAEPPPGSGTDGVLSLQLLILTFYMKSPQGPFVWDSVGSFTGRVLGIVPHSGIRQHFVLFGGWILVHGMHKPKSSSPSAHRWMLEPFPLFGCCKWYELCTSLVWEPDLNPWGIYLGVKWKGLRIVSCFSFGKTARLYTVF